MWIAVAIVGFCAFGYLYERVKMLERMIKKAHQDVHPDMELLYLKNGEYMWFTKEELSRLRTTEPLKTIDGRIVKRSWYAPTVREQYADKY